MWFPIGFGRGKPLGDGITWNNNEEQTETGWSWFNDLESQRPSLISPIQDRSDGPNLHTAPDPNSLMIVHNKSDSKR
jgi:hypothetical protein